MELREGQGRLKENQTNVWGDKKDSLLWRELRGLCTQPLGTGLRNELEPAHRGWDVTGGKAAGSHGRSPGGRA